MIALYGSGRQAEALEVYQDFRHALSDQLGLEPGLGLQQLELAILQRDPALLNTSPRRWYPWSHGTAAVMPNAEARPEADAGSRRELVVLGSLRRRIDAVTGTVVRTIPLGSGATDVAVGDGAVWVSDEAGDRVLRVDPQTDQVSASINVGSGPTAIAVGFGTVWVSNSLDGTVSRIDPSTNTVTATVTLGDGAGALALDRGDVWVASQ